MRIEHEQLLLRATRPFLTRYDAIMAGHDVNGGRSRVPDSGNAFDRNSLPQVGTALEKTLNVLDESLKALSPSTVSAYSKLPPVTDNVDVDDLPRRPRISNILNLEHRLGRLANLRASFDLYFTHLNPNLPIVNENHFRIQFDEHLKTDETSVDSRSKNLFTVLVNFIYAETLLLSERYDLSSPTPGWPEFSFAEGLLDSISWLHRGSIQLIQCHLLKARFLATIQKMRLAYNTMCKVFQICFHMGLHDEQTWGHASPYERTMLRRIFWSTFYLDRGIASSAGLPYIIREHEINVELPEDIDDTQLYPNRPLPEENKASSCIPYLCSLVRWAKLFSRIWDSMFSPKSAKPPDEALIASFDAEILYSVCQLPSTLWWNQGVLMQNTSSSSPSYLKRQMCLAHLVSAVHFCAMALALIRDLACESPQASHEIQRNRCTKLFIKSSRRGSVDCDELHRDSRSLPYVEPSRSVAPVLLCHVLDFRHDTVGLHHRTAKQP